MFVIEEAITINDVIIIVPEDTGVLVNVCKTRHLTD